jgi:hypothetical protein
MKDKFCFAALAAFALLAPLVACSKPKVDEAPAIKESVMTYVRDVRGLSVDQMNIDVQSVTVEGTKATAVVSFALKAGGMPPLAFEYQLEKKDGKWGVTGSKPAAGAAPHGGGAPAGSGMPSGMPPGMGMPPGHPPVGSAVSSMPASTPAAVPAH